MLRFFKYLYSFFFEIVVEKTQSNINPSLEVTYVNGKLVLNTKASNYSYGSLHRVFQKVFKKIDIQNQEIRDVLILGFGAGSVASILLNEYGLKCKIKGVEVDKKVIDLAEKHFNISGFGDVEIYQEEAAEYISGNISKFDLVVVDVYIDNDVPPQCETESFVKGLGQALNENGIVVFNKLVYNKNTEESAEELYSKFQNILGDTNIYKIKDNWINWMLVYKKS